MKVAACLLVLATVLAMPIVFKPTHEWQPVPDGMSVPGGLEIRMDLDKGGRWARIPPGKEYKDDDDDDDKYALSESKAAVKPTLQTSMLPELEDKAHDFDDGAEIIQNYGSQLLDMYTDPTHEGSETAGHISTICLRNNYEAARAIAADLPHLVDVIKLSDRPINILSALVSTSPGLNLVNGAGVLPKLRRELAYTKDMTPSLAKNIAKLLRNLAVSGGDDDAMCEWVDASTQAFFTTHEPALRDIAREIVDHSGDFESLRVHCRPQPGLLAVQNEAKRAAETSDKLANPKARRNHFDEL